MAPYRIDADLICDRIAVLSNGHTIDQDRWRAISEGDRDARAHPKLGAIGTHYLESVDGISTITTTIQEPRQGVPS